MAAKRIAFKEDGGLCGNLTRIAESELLLKVFCNLDLEDLFRLRSVCKSWYDAVLAPRFRQLYKENHQPSAEGPWAVLTTREVGQQHVREMELWRPLHARPLAKWSFPPLKGMCSSGGLVCGFTEYGSRSLVVINPITREQRYLPRLDPDLNIIGVFMETATDSSYRVVVLHGPNLRYMHMRPVDYERFFTLQYASTTRTWHAGGMLSPDTDMNNSDNPIRERPLVGFAFCCSIFDFDRFLLVYDPGSEAWSYAGFDQMLGTDWATEFISAIRYKDKYYIASFLTTHDPAGFDLENLVTGAAIWEIEGDDDDEGDREDEREEEREDDREDEHEHERDEDEHEDEREDEHEDEREDEREDDEDDRRKQGMVSEFLNTESGNALDVEKMDMQRVTARLDGDIVFIGANYLRHDRYLQKTFGVWSPVAYNFARDEWYKWPGRRAARSEVDIECNYAFLPSLTARP